VVDLIGTLEGASFAIGAPEADPEARS
jgi:hypothetical protein